MQAKEFLFQFSRDELTETYYEFFLKGIHDTEEEKEEKIKHAEELVGSAYDDMAEAKAHPENGIIGAAWSWLLENDLEMIPEGKEKEYAASLIGSYRRIVRNSEIGSLAKAAEEEKKRKEESGDGAASCHSIIESEAGALRDAAVAIAEAGDTIERASQDSMMQRFEEAKRIEEEDERAAEEERMEAEFTYDEEETKTATDSPIAVNEDTVLIRKAAEKQKPVMRKHVKRKERRKATVAKKRRKK